MEGSCVGIPTFVFESICSIWSPSVGVKSWRSERPEGCVCAQGFAMEEYFEEIAIAAEEIEERVEEEEAAVCRRPYTVRQRQDPMDFYDDDEFVQRFRLSKRTVAYVVTLIEDQIRPDSDRNAAVSPTLQVLINGPSVPRYWYFSSSESGSGRS